MLRRNFVDRALVASAWPALARAQASDVTLPATGDVAAPPAGDAPTVDDGAIEPTTPLEFAFVSALPTHACGRSFAAT